ncbi:valine--tRNA ligase [archaeon]|jgi:valyl-tRNA synthetase|nr:valine--tRNA ligase [archaeon]MBT4373630.1 valine--tRNA ligase [archaeon]MBT4531684.1 valine--tRNA ligase [archaeon]MBT7001796.1 valine--tRNA ligase [archaeon]MBT7281781.1 valine--tRNA ligase [archaeon]
MALKDIKNWSPEVEKEIVDKWKKAELFNFDKNTKKKIYSIDTPPPYINAPVHMGHAVTYAFMDMFARYKRMKGFEVLFPLGLDNNGLPIEMGAEKKYKISAFKMGREEFLGYCKKLIDECGVESIDSFARIGISFSSYKEGNFIGAVYKTDSPEYRKLTQATFIELFKKGLVYEDSRINNWDPKLRTTIADSEIEYKDLSSNFNDIKWKVKETGEEIIIGTTRPELICTCGMVIFNPKDERYKHLGGKTVISPIFEEEIKIKSHPLADIEKGTGIAMMCSAGDLSDIQFFREQGLEPRIAIGKDGRMNEQAGVLKGLKVREAREKIIELLREKNLLVKQEKISHRTPVSERSGAEIEFIEMPEYYLKQMEFKEKVEKISTKINFYPKKSKKILDDWIDKISIDWPISRRRFYATEIPLWYAEDAGKKLIAVPTAIEYFQPWKDEVPKDAEVWCEGKNTMKKVKDFKLEWKGEERVLDTWMDSSISELNLLKYKSDDVFFKKAYPATLRPQGKEIVRTWLYYTLLRGYLETGKSCFEDVWIHQHILDGKGKKMSKSVGNIINPQEILKDYGGEALRLWAAVEGDLSKGDFICSKDKMRAEMKTLTKLLNVSRFVMMFNKPVKKPKVESLDKLFIDYLEDLSKRCDESYAVYDFNHPAQDLRRFLWEVFASHYLEVVKSRAYNQEDQFSEQESNSAKWTLHYLLERFLCLIYPIIPQVTTTIAEEKGIDLLKADWPKANLGKSDLKLVEKIMEFNSEIWKKKRDAGISLRDSIEGIKLPKGLKEFEKDLKSCHKI